VTEVNGSLAWGTPKGHERREVPIPSFLVDELAAHVAGRGRDDLVFPGTKGAVLRVRVFRRGRFDGAAAAIGVADMHPHELRHTAASLAKVRGIAFDATSDMDGDWLPVRERPFWRAMAA
jgi:integrase